MTAMEQKHGLWYREPAAEWNEALPIGNGRLGAMIFGARPKRSCSLTRIRYGTGSA